MQHPMGILLGTCQCCFFFFFLVHRSSPNDHFSESFLIVRRKFFSPPAFLKHPLKSNKQLLCSLNHNTKTEKETKINNAHVLRNRFHWSFNDNVFGERLYSAAEGSLVGKKSLEILLGSFFHNCGCFWGGIAVEIKAFSLQLFVLFPNRTCCQWCLARKCFAECAAWTASGSCAVPWGRGMWQYSCAACGKFCVHS